MNAGICKETDCKKKPYARGWCQAHYMYWRRRNNPKVCSDDNCSSPVYAKGLCEDAYAKWLRTNNPDYYEAQRENDRRQGIKQTALRKAQRQRENPFGHRVEEVSYRVAHQRIVSWRGKASDYDCVSCTGPAEEWSLNIDAGGIIWGDHGGYTLPYSLDMYDYSPRCRPCHIEYDSRGLLRKG